MMTLPLKDLMNDFLNLENYFNRDECALFVEDLEKQYGPDMISSALEQGILEQRLINIGPDYGRILCTLSTQARRLLAKA
tara:strand:- start:377 stop:616 length:240 start_codon:yes stop_codon:yes gene_type:complete